MVQLLCIDPSHAATLDALHRALATRAARLAAGAETAEQRESMTIVAQQCLCSSRVSTAAAVREYMLDCLQRDSLLHGLFAAAAAVANCDGSCTEAAAAAAAAAVQPAAAAPELRWLRKVTLDACTAQRVPQLCTCRAHLLRRLTEGPDWDALLRAPSTRALVLAAQPLGTPQRRWVLAACLDTDQSRSCAQAVGAALRTQRDVGHAVRLEVVLSDTKIEAFMQQGLIAACAHALATVASRAHLWVTQVDRPQRDVHDEMPDFCSTDDDERYNQLVLNSTTTDRHTVFKFGHTAVGYRPGSWQNVWCFVFCENRH